MASGQTAVVVRVLSWNIEHGRNIDQAIEEIRSTPELDGIDIVLVCKRCTRTRLNGWPMAWAWLTTSMPWPTAA